MRFFVAILALGAVFLAQPKSAEAGKLRDFGDFSRVGAPAAALILTILHRDPEGFAQMGAGYFTGRVATYGLKRIIKRKRPNFKAGDEKLAFPSGHVEETWQAASFVRKRYGCYEFSFDCMKYTVPFAAVAAVTAYSRIDADRHDFLDVLGGVVLAEAVNWVMVDKFDPSFRVVPTFNNGFGLAIFKRF